jgi:hypothetical protein
MLDGVEMDQERSRTLGVLNLKIVGDSNSIFNENPQGYPLNVRV